MYHFKPISDCLLFKNMETQHFYTKEDNLVKFEGIERCVHWYPVEYDQFKMRGENEIFKRVELNSEEIGWNKRECPLPIVEGKCVVPYGITSIGYSCFSRCSSMTSIDLPA